MEIVAAAGNTALHILAVVPEVQCKNGLGVAPLVHLLIHQRTLLRANHQLGYRAFAGGHIGKEPGKLNALVDEPVHILVRGQHIGVFAGVAQGGAKGHAPILQPLHGSRALLESAGAATEVVLLLVALNREGRVEVAYFADLISKAVVDQRTVGKAQECAVRVLSANTHQILAAHGRLTAGVQIHICTQLLALGDNTGQVVVRQRTGMAVLGSPAAGALQVAGSGGIHQDRPRHIAAVLLNGSHTLGVAVNGYIHQRLNQLIEHMLICIANQISGKAHPVIIRVIQHLVQTGIGGTVNLLYIRHLHQAENAGCVLIKILTRILDRVFYDNSCHCFFESHNT